jgi:hypothetical protein
MLQVLEMNIDSIMYDSQSKKTINGIPAGYLNPSYPHVVGPDGKKAPVDVHKIVQHFHAPLGGSVDCVFTGLAADGINVIDANPNNFLITNLEPVCKVEFESANYRQLPKARILRTYHEEKQDYELELYGQTAFIGERALHDLTIPEVPHELGLAYDEARLLWIWNYLTKKQLLKGLTRLSVVDRQNGTSVSIDNRAVLEYVLRALQVMEKEKDNG